jgi:DNA-directed RNA polymerase subunit H (RpoH/RPB5)
MNVIDKINRSRYSLKEILSDEWDTTTLPDLSNDEIKKMYGVQSSNGSPLGIAAGCNFSFKHKYINSHKLHVIYYNFPEIGKIGSKITKSCADKIEALYKTDLFDMEDSIFVIIDSDITDSLTKSFTELNLRLQNELSSNELSKEIIDDMKKNDFPLEKRHFRNVYLFNIKSLTNNLLNHRLVPKHIQMRKRSDIEGILNKCNCSLNQLPLILKDDSIAKLIRLTPGDLCEIKRFSEQCGDYSFYRLCK